MWYEPYIQSDQFWVLTLVLFIVVLFRYAIIAGLFHLIFYAFHLKRFQQRKIFKGHFKGLQLKREMLWSALTSLLFGLAGAVMIMMTREGHTKIYEDPNAYPLWWIPLSFLFAAFLHETYYYWLHRWMHRPKVYRAIHKVHHDSHFTSPWTSFSFHPIESLLQSIVIPALVFIIPMYSWTVVCLLVFMTLTSAINHSNVELYPKGFHKHWLGKWLIGATHHSLHHTQYRFNFGLYFTFWDKLMQTESAKYEPDFEKHTTRKNA